MEKASSQTVESHGPSPPEARLNAAGGARPDEAAQPLVGVAHSHAPSNARVVLGLSTARPRPRRRFLVGKACFCLSLRSAAMTIAVLQVIFSIIGLVITAGRVSLLVQATSDMEDPEFNKKKAITIFTIYGIIMVLVSTITLVFGSLLLHGTRKKRPGYVRAWVIYSGILICISASLWIFRIVEEPINRVNLFIECIMTLVPSLYFFIVVRSYYYKLVDDMANNAALELYVHPITNPTPSTSSYHPPQSLPPPPYSSFDTQGGQPSSPTKAPVTMYLRNTSLPVYSPNMTQEI